MRESMVRVGEAEHLALTLPVRGGAVFSGAGPVVATVDGVVYSVSGSSDLTRFDGGVIEVELAADGGLPVLGEGWSYRTFRTAGEVSEAEAGCDCLL